MRVATITRNLPPCLCGIGDYTVLLRDSLRSLGHEVEIFAGRGKPEKHVHIIGDEWNATSLAKLFSRLRQMALDRLVLQYTPLMYPGSGGANNRDLAEFWAACNEYWRTCIVVHETYFREIWYPPSWRKGSAQKRLLRKLVNASHVVFSASEPLVDEIASWGKKDAHLLPIGSNFPIEPVERENWRLEHEIAPDDIVLTLFGGGTSLKWLSAHVNLVDRLLQKNGVPACWLLLGGIPLRWFSLKNRVISPGRLPAADVSAWLQATDIFLMPHHAGICAKRGTLMAAMQHGVPVIGTKGTATDSFWKDIGGVNLVPITPRSYFSRMVLALATDQHRREVEGNHNRDYFSANFTWQHIARKFSAAFLNRI